MFKALRNGRRNSSGSARVARVSSKQMGHGRSIIDEQRRRPAFMPLTPQEQGMDSKNSRLSGLED